MDSCRLTKSRRVYLDEAGTVDEDLGPHVAGGDELLPVLQPGYGHAAQRLEEAGPLARPQPAHKLHQVLGVGVRNALVNVYAHVIHQIDEVEIQRLWSEGGCQKVGLTIKPAGLKLLEIIIFIFFARGSLCSAQKYIKVI